jgi:16S rRNA (cytidine1402-2'-O)-methyltransferase
MKQQQEFHRILYLIPSLLGDTDTDLVLPNKVVGVIQSLEHFIVEEERPARRFLVKAGYRRPISSVKFYLLNEHTPEEEIPVILTSSGSADIGLLSDAGLPAVADPGAELVKEAHRHHIRIMPLTGPSSLMLALMASGMNGQQFAFNGYLPVKDLERTKRIRFLEKRSIHENQSQLFIETPYRNNQLLRAILKACHPLTRLCIAVNLTLETEWICTRTIREWKTAQPDLNRQPAVFILQG